MGKVLNDVRAAAAEADSSNAYTGSSPLGSFSQEGLSREPLEGFYYGRYACRDQMHGVPDDGHLRQHRVGRSRNPHPRRAAVPAQEDNPVGHLGAYYL